MHQNRQATALATKSRKVRPIMALGNIINDHLRGTELDGIFRAAIQGTIISRGHHTWSTTHGLPRENKLKHAIFFLTSYKKQPLINFYRDINSIRKLLNRIIFTLKLIIWYTLENNKSKLSDFKFMHCPQKSSSNFCSR